MPGNELQHLIKMANQIALNIGMGASEEDIVDKIENHITLFWARPMREKICSHMDSCMDELNPATTKALLRIKEKL